MGRGRSSGRDTGSRGHRRKRSATSTRVGIAACSARLPDGTAGPASVAGSAATATVPATRATTAAAAPGGATAPGRGGGPRRGPQARIRSAVGVGQLPPRRQPAGLSHRDSSSWGASAGSAGRLGGGTGLGCGSGSGSGSASGPGQPGPPRKNRGPAPDADAEHLGRLRLWTSPQTTAAGASARPAAAGGGGQHLRHPPLVVHPAGDVLGVSTVAGGGPTQSASQPRRGRDRRPSGRCSRRPPAARATPRRSGSGPPRGAATPAGTPVEARSSASAPGPGQPDSVVDGPGVPVEQPREGRRGTIRGQRPQLGVGAAAHGAQTPRSRARGPRCWAATLDDDAGRPRESASAARPPELSDPATTVSRRNPSRVHWCPDLRKVLPWTGVFERSSNVT